MSLSPQPPQGLVRPSPEPGPETTAANSPKPKVGWQRRLLRISLALFTFEVGVFLVFFPWTDKWDVNSIQSLTPALQSLWREPSFKGAVTGLGFVNVYIAFLQAVHSFRRN
jgi:hypothetical protein